MLHKLRKAAATVQFFLLALLLACSAVTGPSRPVITQADDGKTFRLNIGGRAMLRLSNEWLWSEPRREGESVESVRVVYESDPGFREWELKAARAGRTTLSSEGAPSGRGSAGSSRRFKIVIEVLADKP